MYIDIKAVGKESVRSVKNSSRMYIPSKTKNFMSAISAYARIYIRDIGVGVTDGPVAVNVIINKAVPKSWSDEKRTAALNGDIIPDTKPDNDNVVKGIHDAMKGIVYTDDCKVPRQFSGKWYAEKDSIHISINYLPNSPHYKLMNHVDRNVVCDCGKCVI